MAVAVLFCSIGLGAQNNPYKIDDACYEIMSRAPDWALASAAVIQTAKSLAEMAGLYCVRAMGQLSNQV